MLNHSRQAVALIAIILFNSPIAFGYTVQGVAGGGALKGKITFSGTAPDPVRIPIEKNPEVCGTGFREIKEVTVDKSGGLQHAVVYFQKIDAGKKWPEPEKGWQLKQKTCTFIPWIQVIPNKSELEVESQDPVLHNIHTYELIGDVRVTMFNEAQPTQGYTFKKNVKMRKGTTMKVECDAHNFMHAYTKVLDNPYYAITAPDGTYSIDGIPSGKYKVIVWHSLLGETSMDVDIGAGKAAELSHKFTK